MKYIIFFIIGIIWTIWSLAIGVIIHILCFIWDLEFMLGWPFEPYTKFYREYWEDEEVINLPLFNKPSKYSNTYKSYKSYFHYIWGIN